MAKKSKKKKSVKKYAVGGDMRYLDPSGSGPQELTVMPPDYGLPIDYDSGFGGGGYDQSATGQVGQVSESARRAAAKLRGAGLAQQQAGSMLGNAGDQPRPPIPDYPFGPQYRKGGKVKKPAKKAARTSAKVRGVGRAVQKKIRPARMIGM